MDWPVVVGMVLAAAVMEFVDSGIGMGYGTVLTPLLMAFGYNPLEVVPAILLSQAVGGLTATVFHHKHENVDVMPRTMNPGTILGALKTYGIVESFRRGFTDDMKKVLAIIVLGVVAAAVGSVLAVHVAPWVLNAYIGAMVTGIGILLLWGRTFQFSWKKLIAVGFFASFNKGFSGGGFGPIATGGQVVITDEHRSSIGRTTLAEAPICIIAFVTYVLQKGFTAYSLLAALCVGAAVGAVWGPMFTKRLSPKWVKLVLGLLLLVLGALMFLKLGGTPKK
jgi:uncharacterized protein